MREPIYRPTSLTALSADIAHRCHALGAGSVRVRIAVDGADAAAPATLADAVADRLRFDGVPVARVSLRDWLRPASVRLEHGHTDEHSYRHGWFDLAALTREVLIPLATGGSGRWIPTLRDTVRDRSSRAAPQHAAPGTVLVVDGPMLIGRCLPFDLTVHLHVSAAALLRRTDEAQRWTVAAVLAHEAEVDTDEQADVLVRAEHADRPAQWTG